MSDEERGTLKEKEPHPAALMALAWLQEQPIESLAAWQSAFASVAISGNRLAEICSETLDRLKESKPVSDRYLLGLCWTMRFGMEDTKDEEVPGVRGTGETTGDVVGKRGKTSGRGRGAKEKATKQ